MTCPSLRHLFHLVGLLICPRWQMFSSLIVLYCVLLFLFLLFLLRNQSRFYCSTGLISSFPSTLFLIGPHDQLPMKSETDSISWGTGSMGSCAPICHPAVCQFGWMYNVLDPNNSNHGNRSIGKDLRSYLNALPSNISKILLQLAETLKSLFVFKSSYPRIYSPFFLFHCGNTSL